MPPKPQPEDEPLVSYGNAGNGSAGEDVRLVQTCDDPDFLEYRYILSVGQYDAEIGEGPETWGI